MKYPELHDEVLGVLRKHARPARGEAVRKDRRSELDYLGIPTPELRKLAKQGFSFYAETDARILDIWNDLWTHSPWAEVLFAALEYYRAHIRKGVPPGLWRVVRKWSARIENWAHADALAGLYSFLLEADPKGVYPQLERWNRQKSEWLRRLSIVSLIHYSGKNAVFLEADRMFPLITSCLDDPRADVQKAVGWVLREMDRVYPEKIDSYLKEHAARIAATAFTRAIERRSASEKKTLRELRKAALAKEDG